jgi:hypothetical protein
MAEGRSGSIFAGYQELKPRIPLLDDHRQLDRELMSSS